MRKLYFTLQMLCICFLPILVKSQDCSLLNATCLTFESRCAATGSIKITATGGSGNYRFRAIGPVTSNFTTSDSITGLSTGSYSVIINDIITNCTITKNNIVVPGNYQDPRFTLTKSDVSCDNSNNGSITVTDPLYGTAPFSYSIVAPSPTGIGTTNSSGYFPNLIAGDYSIRMTDSCGGIQTRQITLLNYTWWIDSYAFIKTDCNLASGFIKVIDSRGNISTVGGIPGFSYGIVRAAGDTTWSTNPNFSFILSGQQQFTVVAKDQCGIIKKAPASVNFIPSIGATTTITNKTCSTFSVTLNNITNFILGQYCLYNNSNTLIQCNSTGAFTSLPYGSYCIVAKESCTDTSITRCFTVTPPALSVNNNIKITNKSCSTFTAAVTSQTGLTNPQFCLFTAANVQVSCNTNGIFNGVNYGSYCIKITDGCRDTTITRCFTVLRPKPVVNPVSASYITCTGFGIAVGGDSLNTPSFCLYDSTGALIMCNSTGIFDSLDFGAHCVTVYDPCYDTTITRCFSVWGPTIVNNLTTNITSQFCSTFNVTVAGPGLVSPEYCLYNNNDSLISCNSSGIFTGIDYGTYCVKARNACPDTTFIKCFTASPPIPSIGATINTSNITCSGFTATVTGQTNISSPQYCVYDTANTLLGCNSTGVFVLQFGSYCIATTSDCYDTLITRCVTVNAIPGLISVTAVKSCKYGTAKITLNTGNLNLPVTIKILKPDGSLLLQSIHYATPVVLDSIAGIPAGMNYKLIATDNCGNKDSASFEAIASYFNHSAIVSAKCPGGSWVNGSGNIDVTIGTNMGDAMVQIIKKDGVAYGTPLTPNTATSTLFKFIDLGPGVYIIRSSEYYCNKNLYDTVTIYTYQYPNLSRSSAYQCDVNGFSVGAVASNGVGPFTYEIIGSSPALPSIISGPQPGPIFNINNGSDYSLIRLRAVDACGNATLGDASILPLANNGVTADYNCLMMPVNLTVDSMFNSTYSWYKKSSINSSDSIFMGNGPTLHIPNFTYYDIGIYVCHVSVNNGCIRRSSFYNLDGSCYIVLPTVLEYFKGNNSTDKNELQWQTSQEGKLQRFIIERKTGQIYTEIGNISTPGNTTLVKQYNFTDALLLKNENLYRLKLENTDHTFTYSNIIRLGGSTEVIRIYPNPAIDNFTIEFNMDASINYRVSIINTMKQEILLSYKKVNGKLLISRPAAIKKGIYMLQITEPATHKTISDKILFL